MILGWLWQMQLDKANILGRLLGWISEEGNSGWLPLPPLTAVLSNISTFTLYKCNIKPLTTLAGDPQNIFTKKTGEMECHGGGDISALVSLYLPIDFQAISSNGKKQ